MQFVFSSLHWYFCPHICQMAGTATLNEINDLIETGFVQTTTRHTISLHPMIKEIALSETKHL